MPQTSTTYFDELLTAAFYPVWILGSISVVAIGVYGVVRCFRRDKRMPGFGLIALIAVWLAVQPLYPFVMFVAVYCEAHCSNTGYYLVSIGYLSIAGLLSFGILRYAKKIG